MTDLLCRGYPLKTYFLIEISKDLSNVGTTYAGFYSIDGIDCDKEILLVFPNQISFKADRDFYDQVGLIGFYVSHVLHSWRNGAVFALSLAALYGLLYGLLSAEDYALLMGSLLLFGLLGVFMVLTRKLDWDGVGAKPTAAMNFELGEVK